MITQIDHDQAGHPRQLGGDPAEPLLEFHRLPLVAHTADLAEVEQYVAEHAQRRGVLVLLPVPEDRLLPLVEHCRRHGGTHQRVVHPAPKAVDRSDQLPIERCGRRDARACEQLQKMPA